MRIEQASEINPKKRCMCTYKDTGNKQQLASMPIADVMVPSPLAKVRTAHKPTPANPIQHRKQGQHNSRRQNTQRAKSKIASSGQIY